MRTMTLIRFVLRFDAPGGVTVPGHTRRDPSRVPQDVPAGRTGRAEPDAVQDRVDAVLDTDHRGLPHLPATSLAGALRQAVADAHDREHAAVLFGHLNKPDPHADAVDAVASQIWVQGSRWVDEHGHDLDTLPDSHLLYRSGTAIDRGRAAAAVHTLRTQQLLPVGTRFEVYLRWDNAEPADRDDLLAVLAGWRPLIGAGVTRGYGRCSVENLRWGALRLSAPDDLLQWATCGGPDLFRRVATRVPENLPARGAETPGRSLLDVPVRLEGPLLVGNGTVEKVPRADGETTDVTLPLHEQGTYLIPGSTLKGVVRSRCEYVLRTIAGPDAACTDQHCGRCLPCLAFGHGGGTTPHATAVGRRGRIGFRDAPIAEALSRERTHVAVDRFTGGAAPGLLFTDRVLEAGTFRLVIEDLGLTGEQRHQIAALVRVVLADLDDGLIGIGRATARGYGTTSVDLTGAEAPGSLPTLTDAQQILAALAAATPDPNAPAATAADNHEERTQ